MNRRRLFLLLLVLLCGNLLIPAQRRALAPEVPVVLVHGQGGNPDLTWKTVIARLEQKGYRQGETLFAVDLSKTGGDMEPYGLLQDVAYTAAEIRRVVAQTGARQVDLVGHSRGGLIIKFLILGDTASLIRRVVTLNTPYEGVLPEDRLSAILDAAGVSRQQRSSLVIPLDLLPGSGVLRTLVAKEQVEQAPRVPALVIGTTWQDGVPPVLAGSDGAVPLSSQLAWPGAVTEVFKLGPTPAQIESMLHSGLGPALLVFKSPHLQSLENNEVIERVAGFLLAARVPAPFRPCGANCDDRLMLAWGGTGQGGWGGNPVGPAGRSLQ